MIDPSNGPIMCLQSMSEDWINGWNQWDLINNTSKTIDLLIRAENIKEDLKELWFMPDDFEVPFLGKTDYPTINFDENHLRQVCVERFSNDYIKFGYEKDEVYEIWERPKKKFRFRKKKLFFFDTSHVTT